MDWKNRRLIYNIDKAQSTEINANGCKKKAKIRTGMRYTCLQSPYLFNIFIEVTVDIKTRKIKINGIKVHCTHFAHDLAIVADSEKE